MLSNLNWQSKKKNDVSRKFQDSWAAKLPWVELCLGSNGNLHIVKCRICSEVEGKDKIFAIKLDSLCKHVGWNKAKKNIGTNVKKGDWYHFKDNRHAKNYVLLGFRSHGNVAT